MRNHLAALLRWLFPPPEPPEPPAAPQSFTLPFEMTYEQAMAQARQIATIARRPQG